MKVKTVPIEPPHKLRPTDEPLDAPGPASADPAPLLAWRSALAARALPLALLGCAAALAAVATAQSWTAGLLAGLGALTAAAGAYALGTATSAGERFRDDASEASGALDILAALPDAAMLVSANGIVAGTNHPLAALFPNARADMPVSHACRSPELLQALETAHTEGRRIVEIEERVPVRRKLLAVVTPLSAPPAAGDRPVVPPPLLVVLRDVSAEERLARMRADFIANASHELRTPLAALRGFVETLQGPARNDPAARERFLGIMAAQAARMTRLIDDLLSLSRVEMRAHIPPTGTVDLSAVAASAVQALEPLAAAAGTTVAIHPLAGPSTVVGDRDELMQVVQNLVQNAIKYGRDRGKVEVRLSREPDPHGGADWISLAVVDDGPGIAPEHLPRLTERFYRVSAASSQEKGGTGLGLAIVKNILARHRGEFDIASKVGEGSTFTVRLKATGS